MKETLDQQTQRNVMSNPTKKALESQTDKTIDVINDLKLYHQLFDDSWVACQGQKIDREKYEKLFECLLKANPRRCYE